MVFLIVFSDNLIIESLQMMHGHLGNIIPEKQQGSTVKINSDIDQTLNMQTDHNVMSRDPN